MDTQEQEAETQIVEPFISPQYYRIKLLVDSLDRESYDQLLIRLKGHCQNAGFSTDVIITGTLDRIIEIQRYLMRSLLKSLLITISAVVCLLFIILGRGRYMGAIFYCQSFSSRWHGPGHEAIELSHHHLHCNGFFNCFWHCR